MNSDPIAYYRERAREYGTIYLKPERQDDLRSAATILQRLLENKAVLRIACGMSDRTAQITKTPQSVFATDINELLLEIARQNDISRGKVIFSIADVYKLPEAGKYDSLFGGFIWSRIPLQELDGFIGTVNNAVASGGTVVFIDNNYAMDSTIATCDSDEHGNTYQTGQLKDGRERRVLKNFPTETFLREKLSGIAESISIIRLRYYWILIYRLAR